MSLVVQKYGGTSVGSLDHIRRVARHVAHTVQTGKQVLVTISAMGEQTDELLAMALALNPKPPRRELDMLLTAGERMSAALLSIALADMKVDSVSFTGSQSGILTDENHGNARITSIVGERLRANLTFGRVVIVAGFQGVTETTKEVTTLGRGGSDLTAIALAAALKADACELYKDVPGVFTADPRLVPTARVMRQVSWSAMTALAWGGAAVLHSRGAHLAAKYRLPFEIRSSLELLQAGTRIQGSRILESPHTEALAHKRGMALLNYHIRGKSAATAIAKALAWAWQQGEAPQVCQQVASGDGVDLALVVKASLAKDLEETLREAAVAGGGSVECLRATDGLASITVVGFGYKQSPETLTAVCEAVGGTPLLVEPSDTAITLCLQEEQLSTALNRLHDLLIPPAL